MVIITKWNFTIGLTSGYTIYNMKETLQDFMALQKKTIKPLFVQEINETYIIAVYKGKFSEFDILIKYRQKLETCWSRIRTPKHIHWVVDMLIKMYSDKQSTENFLRFLLDIWSSTSGIRSQKELINILNIDNLLKDTAEKLEEFKELGTKGEYSIKFLILLAKLLMIQEKTNREDAYMFKDALNSLLKGDDIFKIVSIASHTGRS